MSRLGARLLASAVLFVTVMPLDLAAQDKAPAVRWEYGLLRYGLGRTDGQSVAEWVSGKGYVRGKGWDGLAEKLSAPALNEELLDGNNPIATETLNSVRVLNHLGHQGWEMVSHNSESGTAQWCFKRQAQK